MIVIDAGHGGDDPGAIGGGIIEKNMNLDISKYMNDRFSELGVPVKMTRTTDETLSPSVRTQRVINAFGNNPNVLVLSNHINAGGGDGAEVIYALRNTSTLSNLILEEIAKEGQNIRKAYQRRLPSDTSKDYYFMHRETGVTQPVIIEYGFLDSPGDDVQQLKNNWQNYSEAVVRAVMKYLNLPYTPPEGADVYVVQPGDSLWSVAKKFNITVEELKAANNLTTNLLSVGQILKIPTVQPEPVPGEYIVYTVQAGDSLYSIAQRYNTTVDNLISYNNLSTTSLKIGQQLLIPTTTVPPVTPPVEPPTDFITYTVKSGDNLYAIARTYNTTVNAIMQLNNLTSTSLSIGQQLRIPTTTTPPEEPPVIPPEEPPTDFITYTVKSGDNLYAIARTYNTTIDEIMRLNNLTSTLLSLGQQLKIPTATTPPQVDYIDYVVKSGDNLYSIAQRYNTTTTRLMEFNNLKTNLLSIGQVLRIPTTSSPVTYTVKSGDNLYSIAQRFNTTADEIKRKNNLTSNLLSIGQILII
jgi:LysM repeat protein